MTAEIPQPHVIREVEKKPFKEERIPLQLPLPMPQEKKKEQEPEQRVITIQL